MPDGRDIGTPRAPRHWQQQRIKEMRFLYPSQHRGVDLGTAALTALPRHWHLRWHSVAQFMCCKTEGCTSFKLNSGTSYNNSPLDFHSFNLMGAQPSSYCRKRTKFTERGCAYIQVNRSNLQTTLEIKLKRGASMPVYWIQENTSLFYLNEGCTYFQAPQIWKNFWQCVFAQ